MKKVKVRLKTIDNVKRFTAIASQIGINASVYSTENPNHVVPVDSILGVFSLNLNNDLEMTIDKKIDAKFQQFLIECEEWIIS